MLAWRRLADRLRFALEPRPLVRPGVGAGDQHLEGDEAVEPEVPGLVDQAHAPAPEEGLHLIAGYLRQLGARMPGERGYRRRAGVGPRRRKQRIELRLDGAHLQPAPADLGQQLGASGADLLRSTPGVAELVEQLLHPRIDSHDWAPRGGCVPGLRYPENPLPAGMHLDGVRRLLARAEVGQLLRQEPQAAAQPSLHRHRRDAEHLGGLRLRHPLDSHQVEDLPLVLRQLADRRSMRQPSGLSPETLLAGAGTSPSHSSTAAG